MQCKFKRSLLRAMTALIVFGAIALTGCATHTTERFFQIQGDAGKAIIYVYRDRGFIGHGLELEIVMNDEPAAKIPVGTFFATHAEPGTIRFAVRAKRGDQPVLSGVKPDQLDGYTLLELKVNPAQTYYIEIEEGLGYVLLESQEPAIALEDMKNLRRWE
jgi:hypothetical protein